MRKARVTSGGSLELLLGPAGCGKSHRLRQEFVSALQQGAEPLLLVPTASYRDHTRNEVLRKSGLPGFDPASICTFNDLLRRLAAEPPELTAARRELLVRRLLRHLSLPSFAAVRDYAGFRETLAEAVEEVRRAGLTPEQLESALGVSQRHRDFLLFLREYNGALRAGGLDGSARLAAALERLRARIGRAGAVPAGLLLVDGFSDFTAEQRQLLAALAGRARDVRVALTLDRHGRDFFYQAERSRAWLKKLPGRAVREVWLESNARAQAEALRSVECALRGEPPGEVPPLWQNERALALLAAADRRDEAELVAREVLRLVRSGYRYRDIGVIVRRPADYAALLRGVFRRLGIPLREFFPRPLAETALGRHLLACLDLFGEGSRPESLLQWLKSPYATVTSRRIVERFEYGLMARAAEAREGRWERLAAPGGLLAGRLEQIRALQAELAQQHTPRGMASWTGRVWRALTREPESGEPESGQPEIEDGLAPERLHDLRAEAATSRRIEQLLAEVVEAAEAERLETMAFTEFRDLLRSLLYAEHLLVRDRRQDAVNLMNPFEARQWELRAVFVVGLVEGEFPAASSEALLLDDADRARIEAQTGVALPTLARRAEDEKLLFYLAATRARERLCLSHPQSDSAGRKRLPSFFLHDLAVDRFPHEARRRGRSEIVPPPELAAGAADLAGLAHAALAAHACPRQSLDLALALYDRLRASGVTARAALGLQERDSRLTEAGIAIVRRKAVQFSPSALRVFAECPYKYFAKHMLGLQDAARPAEIEPQEEGKIAHAAIEQWERERRERPIGEVLDEVFDRITASIPEGHLGAKAREGLRRRLAAFVEAEQQHSAVYRTAPVPTHVELRFGEAGGPQLAFTLEDGTVITVHGRLDRIDTAPAGGKTAAVVLDYKYGKRGFDGDSLEKARSGLNLQLPVYLLAVKELLGLEPGGAELYPLRADTGRCGVYNADLATHIFRGDAPAKSEPLSGVEFQAFIESARRWIPDHASKIRGGWIAVAPYDPKICDNCGYYNVCRVKEWEVQRASEKKQN